MLILLVMRHKISYASENRLYIYSVQNYNQGRFESRNDDNAVIPSPFEQFATLALGELQRANSLNRSER